MDLLRAPLGRDVIVIDVVGGICLKQRLFALGIVPGKKIKKVVQHPMGGPIIVEINGSRFALGRGMASKVIVEV
ncbi:MAG: ferrous iron transport protein A [Candidatus Aenigmarchaeota archaeon]|nr:ferrous iron transport protein A [Candidatus Aenigmarchaeota archaeon]